MGHPIRLNVTRSIYSLYRAKLSIWFHSLSSDILHLSNWRLAYVCIFYYFYVMFGPVSTERTPFQMHVFANESRLHLATISTQFGGNGSRYEIAEPFSDSRRGCLCPEYASTLSEIH